MLLGDIDFSQLYIKHKKISGRGRTPVEKWERRAKKIKIGEIENPYLTHFSNTVQLSRHDTILDVGCGSGALAVLLAKRANHVYALDYSPTMLKKVQENAVFHQVDNISTVCKDWYDNWDTVPQCDVVIASRSTLVDDMQAALQRLNQHARKRIYLSYPANPYFVDAQVAHIMGREKQALPDYFYIPAILHSMGLYPNVSFIEYPGSLANTKSFNEFLALVENGEALSTSQQAQLRDWYEADAERAVAGGEPTRWALIDWAPPQKNLSRI